MDSPKVVPVPKSAADLNQLLPNPGTDGYTFFENSAGHPLVPSVEFQLGNAWWMIEMSYLSYATDSQYALDQLARAGLTGAAFGFDRTDPPHILVAHNDEVVIVAFRGTRIDQLADILADISFLPALTSDGLVHRGFQNALLAGGVWDQAKAHIGAISGTQTILFTGHSLGAALATLARRIYRDPRGRPIALYTFGSPRVGDELIYCGNYPAKDYRFVNDADIVPHVPTPPVYGHVGVLYGPDGQPVPGASWEQLEHGFSAVASALGVFSFGSRQNRLRQYLDSLASSSVKPIGDHAPRVYATKIWNSLIA